jgi:predicted nucleic acid-binding protein
MRVVFADAGYWIAMLIPGDELHGKAETVTRQLWPCQIVTTEMVLVELLNFASGRGKNIRGLAAQTVKGLRTDPSVEVVAQTSGQFDEAIDRYASRLDQQWSATDCASFLLMEERHIGEALAHDHDFVQAGFVALLQEDY